MTVEKVKVTKEVAEALAKTEYNFISVGATLRVHAVNGLTGTYAPLQALDIEKLAKALLIGYEIEKSPEEKVREYYEALTGSCDRYAVQCTLDFLGIKIEGVNAE